MSTVVVEDFRALAKNTLRGFARVRLGSGMVLHDVAVHVRDDKLWVSPAGRPAIGKDGTQMRGADGKPLYNPCVSFTDKATADKFSAAVIAALRLSHPEALA